MSFFRFDGTVRNAPGEAIDGVDIYVSTQPNSIDPDNPTIPPPSLATIYSDAAGTQPITQPVVSDGEGNFFFYADPGQYTLTYFDPLNRIPTKVYPDQTAATPGGGSVTSVGMTVPDGFTVTPGAISSAGVFDVEYDDDWSIGEVIIGPATGPASTPTRRRLQAADLPSSGTVTSVAATALGDDLVDLEVTGSPITAAGTLAFTATMKNQDPNTFAAGPASGVSSGPVTARAIVPADVASIEVVPFSSTPVFDASTSFVKRFTLTGDVASMSIINAKAGQRLTFILTQDSSGNHSFAWDTVSIRGATAPAPDAGYSTVQTFVFIGSGWLAESPGISMDGGFF